MHPLRRSSAFRIEPLSDGAYNGDPKRRARSMMDIIYLAVGIGFFVLMASYARFTAKG